MISPTPPAKRSVDLNPSTSPTMSVDDFALVAGIARSTAFSAVHNNEIPSCRFGRRIRIPTAAVRRILALDAEAAGSHDGH